MTDLIQATNCIRAMKENRTYRGHKVGKIKRPIYGLTSIISRVPYYNKGEIVLFKEEPYLSDPECIEEYQGMKQQSTRTVTIESPLTQEEIAKAEDPLLTTRTIIGVPKKHVKEIKLDI